MIELSSSTTDKEIKHILHFADIHIRNGDLDRSRYHEYRNVMSNVLAYMDRLESVAQKQALTVIAGDLFHHKGRMDTPALKLYFWWMDELLSRTPVIMICGNHDYRQEDPKQPDMLETMVLPYTQKKTKHPLYYLSKTDHYVYANIGFGVMSIKDTLKMGNTSGIVKELPKYPDPDVFSTVENISHRIALFHGSISQSALPNEQRISDMNGYPLEWFQGYENVMLGDNHKQQLHKKPFTWAYPGSLIQQDFGETVFGHGFMLWDLTNKTAKVTPEHVYNENGMITMKWSERENEYVVVFGRKETLHVRDAIEKKDFPLHPRVRVVGNIGDEIHIKELLQTHGIEPSYLFVTATMVEQHTNEENTQDDDETIHDKMIQLSDLNSPKHWVDYLAKVAPELDAATWLLQPETMKLPSEQVEEASQMLPTDLVHKITERNHRIQKAIQEYFDELYAQNNTRQITLKHMSWDYAMCYGQGNFFDFEKIENNIALLNGRNAAGKSSFLDVLCIGLYGEPTKHRNMLSGKKMTAKMIHDQRPSHKSVMKVNILFSMEGDEYEITRSFTTQKKEDNSVYAQLHNAQISKVADDRSKKMLVCEGSVAVENWVGAHFGSLDDMLMSTIVCQMDLTNFFYLKQEDQKKILDHALHLGSIAAFGKILKEAMLAHNEWISLLRTSLQTIQSQSSIGWVNEDDIQQQMNCVAKIQEEETALEIKSNELLGKIGVIDQLPDITAKDAQKQKIKIETRLKKYDDIGDSDMELCLMVKGEQMSRFEVLKAELKDAHDACDGQEMIDMKECKKRIEMENLALKNHLGKKVTPDVSKQTLANMKIDIEKWKSRYPSHWYESVDELSSYIDELEVEYTELSATENALLQKPVTRPEGPETQESLPDGFKIKIAKQELDELRQQIAALKNDITHPVRMKEGWNTWKSEWAKWEQETQDICDDMTAIDYQTKLNEYQSFVQEWKNRSEERASLEKDIEECENELLELEKVPFNPECWACKLQPAVLRQQQIEKNRKRTKKLLLRIKQYLEQCEQHGTLDEMQNELLAIQTNMERRKYYERFVEKMENEKEQWDKAKRQWKMNDEIKSQLTALEEKEKQISNYVNTYTWLRWRKWQTTLEETVANKKSKEIELQKLRAFIVEYDTRVKDIQLIQDENDKWDHFEEWSKTMEEIEERMANVQTIENYWIKYEEFNVLEQQIRIHGDNIERIYEKKRLMDEIEQYDKVIIYHEWQEIRNKLTNVREKIMDSQKKLLMIQNTFDQQKHNIDRVEWMQKRLEEWTNRKGILQQLDVKFIGDKQNGDGYKEWIYRERVVPLVTEEVNRFLSTIENIRLKMTYDRKCFLYFLEDRGNTPTLDKASGYQNFVVGLAMRLALSRIGAVGQNVRHLFIDEGFTACDVANIEKVPSLLQGIMAYGGYHSILLMSHLEQVQEAANMKINIERKGVFSYVRWGSEYPSIELEVPESSGTVTKKRGRPRKVNDSSSA